MTEAQIFPKASVSIGFVYMLKVTVIPSTSSGLDQSSLEPFLIFTQVHGFSTVSGLSDHAQLNLWNEIFPAISMGKKGHNHQRFRKCQWGLPKGNTMPAIQQIPSPPTMVIAEEPWGMQDAAIRWVYHSIRWTGNWGCKQSRNRNWPLITEVHTKGVNSVSPEAFISP